MNEPTIAELQDRIKTLEALNTYYCDKLKEKDNIISAVQLILNNSKS